MQRYKYIGFRTIDKQTGGGTELGKIDSTISKHILTKLIAQIKRGSIKFEEIRSFEASLTQFYRQFNESELSKEIDEIDFPSLPLSDGLQLYVNLFNIDRHGIDLSFLRIPKVHQKLISKLSIRVKRSCTVEEFMTQSREFIDDTCNNFDLVKGSCAEPHFLASIGTQINNADIIITFLTLMESIYNSKTHLNIILGSHDAPYNGSSSSICLYFNNIEGYTPINKYIDEMRAGITRNTYMIKTFFPLEAIGEDKRVLDKVLELNSHYIITIYNRMCGSCFRSLHYLINNPRGSMMYIVNPEQGLNTNDTPEIIKCFSK